MQIISRKTIKVKNANDKGLPFVSVGIVFARLNYIK